VKRFRNTLVLVRLAKQASGAARFRLLALVMHDSIIDSAKLESRRELARVALSLRDE
jgi:hypothetical protein